LEAYKIAFNSYFQFSLNAETVFFLRFSFIVNEIFFQNEMHLLKHQSFA